MSHPPFDAAITFFPSTDLDATARFYEDALGLPLALDQGTCRIYRVGPGGYFGFCAKSSAPERPGLILTLVIDDVDGWHDRLVARGVTIDKGPQLNPEYDIYHFFFRDPNGYLLEIQRFEDPRWSAGTDQN